MRPIFIGGCERSWTTLLGAMLGAHPHSLCTPEMQFKFAILRRANKDTGQLDKAEMVKRLAGRFRFRIWDLELDETTISQESVSSREMIEWLVQLYGKKVDKPRPTVWLDHTPNNIRYAPT